MASRSATYEQLVLGLRRAAGSTFSTLPSPVGPSPWARVQLLHSSGPIGIEIEQHVRMLDLARRRLAFADAFVSAVRSASVSRKTYLIIGRRF